MKDIFYRFWNTIKIPLVILFVATLGLVFDELRVVGDFSTISTWEFWQSSVYLLVIMLIPALSASFDKWLREQGFYLEQILHGFRKPE